MTRDADEAAKEKKDTFVCKISLLLTKNKKEDHEVP